MLRDRGLRTLIPASPMLRITLMLLGGWATIVRAQGNCISLQSSKACPAFADYYIDLPISMERYPFLSDVMDIESFDGHLFQYVNSASAYLSGLHCNTSTSSVAYARYTLTHVCAGVIQDTESLACNLGRDLSPPPLCQSTCNTWVDSVMALTADTSLCPDTTSRELALNDLTVQCQEWPGYNGTAAQHCIAGEDNEPGNCGFRDDTTRACQYCSANSGSDVCCSSMTASCKSGLSTAQLVGIVVGAVVAVGLFGFALFWFCRRGRKKRTHKDTATFATYLQPKDEQVNGSKQGLLSQSHYTSVNSSLASPHMEARADPHTPPPVPLLLSEDHANTYDADDTDVALPMHPNTEELFVVVYPYQPQMDDELELQLGDIVCLAYSFDDGWALGYSPLTGHRGAFPTVCVAPMPPEMLEQEAFSSLEAPSSSKILVEDNIPETEAFNVSPMVADKSHRKSLRRLTTLNMKTLKENVRRSISIGTFPYSSAPRSELAHHNTIPKRTASIRHSYTISKVETPTSPTQSTPFFDAPDSHDYPPPTPHDVYELRDQPTSLTRTHGYLGDLPSNGRS